MMKTLSVYARHIGPFDYPTGFTLRTYGRGLSVVALLVLTGCGIKSISPELKYLMSKPIDCNQATEEIKLLEANRPDDLKKTMTVISSVTPQGAVGALLEGDLEDRNRIVNGEHGAAIDQRVMQMRQACNMPAPIKSPA
jgi:hypothetical protein